MQKRVFNIFEKYFSKTDKLILGLSGGADSVFLGQMLFDLQFKNIIVAHFNHNLRKKNADRDERFCKEISQKWQFDFVSEKWEKPNKSEEKCRNARYEFLEKIRKNKNAKAIIIAHHEDDNIETIFFNFLRGSGLKGLIGMKTFDNNRKIFRPLLSISKKEILLYLKKNKIDYKEDETNQEKAYARNYLRNEIFPLLNKKFPEFKKSLLRLSNISENINEHLKCEAGKWIKNNINQPCGYNKLNFLKIPKAIQLEIIQSLWLPKTLDFKQINEILDFIKNALSGKKMKIKSKTLTIFGDNFFLE